MNYFRNHKLIFLQIILIVETKIMQIFSVSVDADVTVIGSGPGGYVAAIKAAQLGFKVR